MTIVAAEKLDPKKYFKEGKPINNGSSFDLTIGRIFDKYGNDVDGAFLLEPGHIVQVVSSEVFNLPNDATAHVTYKTSLTQIGIWALTVGIVDPGWSGPIATTLLNFSKLPHRIKKGEPFLRVSIFEHLPIENIRPTPQIDKYLSDIQQRAASTFPATFLDGEKIAANAGRRVMKQINFVALMWVGLIAVIFTVAQIVADKWSEKPSAAVINNGLQVTQEDLIGLRKELATVKAELRALGASKPSVPANENPPVTSPDVAPTLPK